MSRVPLRIAILGYGQIAQTQHVPSITANPDLDLVACITRRDIAPQGVPISASVAQLQASGLAVDAVSLCNTPGERMSTAFEVIAAGWHTMLEKPPAATLGAALAIEQAARDANVSLFASWHSRFAPAVAAAKRVLAGKRIDRIEIQWREDVRKWHPGQDWIWETSGFGVFDPGVNALSIATEILPCEIEVAAAQLQVPANRQMPIAAHLHFNGKGVPDAATASFDWRETAGEQWAIHVDHEGGSLALLDGGARLLIDDAPVAVGDEGEYPRLYRHFVDLMRESASDVDLRPMRLVADAFLIGNREVTDEFSI
ncbi:D-galactose 1-dehydrogenase [Novosphingobium chloroacetimidivorans]|uniref:D-galactose 1-dehydrogenase n=1 Tax=Novosphingobium chloroacetimidivorans TaxID=1428314 RepID=A0A7W7KDF7_9SPHN|nr:Gfo/Idh/MocA family oxidoreductase [Novosphingobium chloroacetimidivorans]MBB4860800.1 D-galactose 1-dehydrogenase [Novosphingobium chloroacetimidivorans]